MFEKEGGGGKRRWGLREEIANPDEYWKRKKKKRYLIQLFGGRVIIEV